MTAYLISCDNATCAVPEAYREIFRGDEDVVMSTDGWEPGALNLAQGFAMRFRTPLVHGDVTRLLIDFEKDGDDRWSSYAMKLPETTRQRVAERHEKPYRTQLNQRISEDLRRHATVLHLMIHTTADSDGMVTLATPMDAVLAERLAGAWCRELLHDDLHVRHARHVPCLAMAAGLARNFPADRYAQIHLNVSQSFFLEGRPWRWEPLKKRLMDTLTQVVAEFDALSDPTDPSTAPD